jgi:hypothetical protein
LARVGLPRVLPRVESRLGRGVEEAGLQPAAKQAKNKHEIFRQVTGDRRRCLVGPEATKEAGSMNLKSELTNRQKLTNVRNISVFLAKTSEKLG